MTDLELDRFAAAARALDVRVVELEAVTHDRGHEVELGAVEVDEALRIDVELDAVLLEDLVVLSRRTTRRGTRSRCSRRRGCRPAAPTPACRACRPAS